MKMFIPSIGDEIRLLEDWTFPCFRAGGNYNFINKLRPDTDGQDVESVAVTIPKGAVLSVQRIYIRSGKKEWDSLTFSLRSLPIPPKPEPETPTKSRKSKTPKKTSKKASGRFWAKLRDVNGVEFELVEEP